MKKTIIIFCCLLMIVPTTIYASNDELAKGAKSAIIMEANTGKILFKKNIDEKYAPASMTKMMSLLLVMEQIDEGKINLTDMVTVSEKASSMGGSQIFLEQYEKMSVSDLIKGVCIASANDAVTALAEFSYGSVSKFVEKMNDKAKELGLKNTNFKNVHGLDDANHYSSAYDMALIAKELVKHDKILHYSSVYEDYLRKGTDKQVWLVNTNKLVKYYPGSDGLKTGYTKEAGYCLTATAKKENMRLITVVMGEETSKQRNSDTIELLDYGFNSYEAEVLLSKNAELNNVKISKGTKDKISTSVSEDLVVLHKKGDDKKVSTYELILDNFKLPIKKGDVIGKLKLSVDNEKNRYIDVISNDNVDKANIFSLYLKNISNLISGNINIFKTKI